TAIRHPERVYSACSPDQKVYEERYRLWALLLRTLTTEGHDAALTLYDDEIEERLGQTRRDDAEFVELGHKTASGKDGYWDHYELAMRPILGPPLTEDEMARYLELEKQMEDARKAREADMKGIRPLEVKRKRGRPRKNPSQSAA